MRIAAAIIYSTILFAGLLAILVQRHAAESGFIAAHDLPENHLVVPGDIAPAPGSAAYAAKLIKKDQVLSSRDLALFPALKEGSVAAAVPIPRRLVASGTINANSPVHLCKAEKPILTAVTVMAVLCAPAGADCIALVNAPAAKAEDLKAAFASDGGARVEPAQPGVDACKVSKK